jgi:proton-dependent oligopeptide transporter, POT family
MSYRTSPADLEGMPPGVPHIIGNEAAERFSFYGMKAVLAVFMTQYLHLMDGTIGTPMNEAQATEYVHLFNTAVYLTPFLGAFLADIFLGKYRTIIWLSMVYCLGHLTLAFMGIFGASPWWLMTGLALIGLGSGGIKPCVSAHVGDQFGARNAHLIPKIFNGFYFSVNLGAFVSMLLTPWLLEWYGPHLAFGVPGILMAIATLMFWMGRKRFIHVPPAGLKFFKEVFSRAGISALLKLLPLYLFVAIFWALFDQTGSTWIFQSEDMDRNFLGFEWLPSQIQSLNSVFIFIFIPLFSYVLYPLIDRFWQLTPLRKIGVGFFFAVASFALIAIIQQWIDGGERPNISWQIVAFGLLTAAEVMIAIVSLEFAYTQAPKTMKSLLMCYFLGAVAIGNLLVAVVNHRIQTPNAASQQLASAIEKLPDDWKNDPRTIILPGYDQITGTEDDFVQRLSKGIPTRLEIPARKTLDQAATIIENLTRSNGEIFPDEASVNAALASIRDPWNQPLRYQILTSRRVRLSSDGPDQTPNTQWDIGLLIDLTPAPGPAKISWSDRFHPAETWLQRHQSQLGETPKPVSQSSAASFSSTPFSGGQNLLHGAAYFRFFTWLMLATAIAYIPFALLYRPKTYLQD